MENNYQEPTLVELGTVAGLTTGDSDGEYTDADFPVNTPLKNLTFSG